MVQAADFFKFSMQQAKLKGMRTVRWSIFIGKLVKHAMGFPYTHAKDWAIDFNLLADWCAELGMAEDLTKRIRAAITARHVYEMVPKIHARLSSACWSVKHTGMPAFSAGTRR